MLVSNISIEKFLSGKGLESLFFSEFKKKISTKDIFKDHQKYIKFLNKFYNRLSRSLSIIINSIDPDAIVFGGGVSNEIGNLDNLKQMTSNFSGKKNLKTVFLKPKFGDASGVRGAARLGRSIIR